MILKEEIKKDFKIALKKKAKLECSVLRLLNSAIHNKEIEKKAKLRKKGELIEEEIVKQGELIDEEITTLILSEIKKRKEAILEFEKGDRRDLVEKEKKETEFLKRYLPEQLPEEEIKKIVKETIDRLGAQDIKDIGKVMTELMPKIKGRADGSQVSKIVKELLRND